MKYSITSSIVAYNNKTETLKKTINSFLNTNLNVRLFIVDNSPTDKIHAICKDERIEYIFNNANLGFGAGHNLAIRRSSRLSKYHLVLNPDISFEPGVLEKPFNYMESNAAIGLIMPKICYLDGSIQYLCKLLPGPLDLFLRRTNFPILKDVFRNKLDDYELKFTEYNKIMDVPHLSGCFMFMRSNILEKTGIFDERFFMYLEDVDLSRRIHRHSRTVYLPEAVIYHEYEKGSYKNFKNLSFHILSAVKYFNKWGWIFDKERKQINKRALKELKKHSQVK